MLHFLRIQCIVMYCMANTCMGSVFRTRVEEYIIFQIALAEFLKIHGTKSNSEN